jgi:putative colanic acid biosynthesis acetyltransferase WcaF
MANNTPVQGLSDPSTRPMMFQRAQASPPGPVHATTPPMTQIAADGAPKFPLQHKALRLCWQFCWWAFCAWTPPALSPVRVFFLRLFGASIGHHSDVRGDAQVWYPPNLTLGNHSLVGPEVNVYNMAPITIGDNVIISQRAFLCGGTHSTSEPTFPLITREIHIASHCWIAAEAFLAPGLRMGEGAVLGARGAAFKDLKPWTVYYGNPAIELRPRKTDKFGALVSQNTPCASP